METLDFKAERRHIEDLCSQLNSLKNELARTEDRCQKARRHARASARALDVLQRLAQAVQESTHRRISEIVTHCLQVVFGESYRFVLRFERKRGKTEALIRFEKGGVEMEPLDACGGGMVDVACFALRVSCLLLHRPARTPVLFIDEGFKFVSASYRERVREMLEGLSSNLRMQIIQVSHIEELQVGQRITLT